MIRIENVHFSYVLHSGEEVKALSGVSLEFHPGEFVVLFGHNGCGKSTLAKHLNGLFVPAEGDVWLDDLNTHDEARLWEMRQRVGMVFQNPDNQIIATVVEDDVAFGVENLGIPPAEIQRRVDEALTLLGIEHLRGREPHLLSGGQKQLVCLAGVLAMAPRYVILDEPTSLLDPEARAEVVQVATRLAHEQGLGVILITHFMHEAVQADRVVVMDAGAVTMQGTPREVFAQVERLRALKLDVPMTTRVALELRQRHGIDLRPDILTAEELVQELLRCGAPA